MIYTDYSTTVDIAKQLSLSITSIIRLNLRLIRASQYLQRFELNVKYKPGKRNVILDILSRLFSINEHLISSDHVELDVLYDYVYITSLVEISEDLKVRIVKDYQIDPFWIKALIILYKEASYDDEDVAKLPFVLREKVL